MAAAPDTRALKAAHQAARAADCGPALALAGLADAPDSRHRQRAADAQVRCAATTLSPPDPAAFFAEPVRTAALVAPDLRRELTVAVALSTRDAVGRPSTARSVLAESQQLLAAARQVDPSNWMLWENSLLANIQLLDGARIHADAEALVAAWAAAPDPAGARIVGQHCSQSDARSPLLPQDRRRGAAILERCREALGGAYALSPGQPDITAGYLMALEAAAYSATPALRQAALADLRALDPNSVLVGLLEAAVLSEAGDNDGAIARYARVAAQAPDTLEARLWLGTLLADRALTAFTEGRPGARADAQAATSHLEAAFALLSGRPTDQIPLARLLIQLYDRLEDQLAEDRWRQAYSRLMGH